MEFKLRYFYRLAPIFYAPPSNSKKIALVLVTRNPTSLSQLGAKEIGSKSQILYVKMAFSPVSVFIPTHIHLTPNVFCPVTRVHRATATFLIQRQLL